MILTAAQMVDAERAAFARGESAEGLMEIAGRRLAEFVHQFHPRPGTCRVFAGKGHNGGDVLVAARYLAESGWRIEIEPVFPTQNLAPLTAKQLAALPTKSSDAPARPLVVLDGLLGIGSTGEPREPVASAIQRINALRREQAAWVLAADLPSALGHHGVEADATLAMGFAKTSLLDDEATRFVGRLAIAPLPGVEAPSNADTAKVLAAENLRHLLPPRSFDTHKGTYGRVAVLAGSQNYPGAARLCSAAAVHAGAGLVTLFCPPEISQILSAAVIPEVMVSPIEDFADVPVDKITAVAIGPGLGRERDEMVRDFVRRCAAPCVVDADALNAISASPALLKSCAGPRLLTPHPLEMERIFPRQNLPRRAWLEAFVGEFPVTLLLKGSRTLVGEAGSPTSYNSTGHPGMGSGGMGDVLTGVCAALLAQGKSPLEAAKLGAWVCGRSAEVALRDGGASQESLVASDVIDFLGAAFEDLRRGVL
jgi:NAD(P)H-hydrate epimerase